MAGFRDSCLRSGEALFSSSFFYASAENSVAEIMAPGFFPKGKSLQRDDVGFVRGSDGMALVWVTGADPYGRPTLAFVEAGASLATAPDRTTTSPTKKAA